MIKNEIIYNKKTWNQYLSKIKRIETKLIYLYTNQDNEKPCMLVSKCFTEVRESNSNVTSIH